MHFRYKGDMFYNRYVNTAYKKRYIDENITSIKAIHTYQNNPRGRLIGYVSNNKRLRMLST